MNKKMDKKTIKKGLLPYLFIFVIMLGVFYFYTVAGQKVNDLTYDKFIEKLNKEEITELTIVTRGSGYVYDVSGKLEGYKKNESFESTLPLSDEVMKKIVKASDNQDFKLTVVPDPDSSSLLYILVNILPIVLLVGVAFWFFNKQMASNKGSLDFGKSRARLNSDTNKVTFKDVAGLSEEKEEVKELIDFLKAPKKFQKLGARIPKGVLLMGPPGTGKTLLAKAVAGEADVPFYFISGSDFVELFVGVGASRVRDMFKTAKQNAPCIIFIDEIDAVGRQRGAGMGGGHDEREQTLNQMLVEMDGFNGNLGIIVMAATNRPDVLDPALLRPGRFDRQITISNPDVRGREAILKVHARNKHLEPTVKLDEIAQRIPGFSGADIENLLNEAALLAARANRKVINTYDIDEAIDRVMMGPAKKSKKYTEKERKLVAYHEAGHAVIGLRLENASVVQKVTIVPRGQAGGYNLMMPKEETYFRTKTDLLDTICGFLGGRIAEEITFNEVSTGASNDFQQATKIARAMVTEYGMSNLGPMQYEQPQGSVFLGRDYLKDKNFSDQVALEIDRETRAIIENCYDRAKKVILDNHELLEKITYYLLKIETLTKSDIDEIESTGALKWYDDKELAKQAEKEEANSLEEKASDVVDIDSPIDITDNTIESNVESEDEANSSTTGE